MGSLLICPENIIITHDTPRSASELIGSATNVNRNTREGPGKDLERSLNRQYSHDSLFLLRGRMNHVTLLLELLGTDSSSSCLQGGTREPSSTDVLLSLVTSARRDEPTSPTTDSFNFLWVHWLLQIPTERSTKQAEITNRNEYGGITQGLLEEL